MNKRTHLPFTMRIRAGTACAALLAIIAGGGLRAPGQTSPALERTSARTTPDILRRWTNSSAAEIKSAADKGSAEAMFVLGMQESANAKQASKDAARWMFAAVSNGSNLTEQEKADSRKKWGDASETELRSAAERGERGAQWFLGGKIQGQAEKLALVSVSWLEKAANQSYAPAEYELGGMYFKGGPAGADKSKARHWIARAAEHGSEPAQHRFARMLLEDGEDIPISNRSPKTGGRETPVASRISKPWRSFEVSSAALPESDLTMSEPA